jgi:hypothetical protein
VTATWQPIGTFAREKALRLFHQAIVEAEAEITAAEQREQRMDAGKAAQDAELTDRYGIGKGH